MESRPFHFGKSQPNEPIRRTKGALAGLSLIVLLSSLDTSIANTALPTLSKAFAASFEGVQWVVLAYLLACTSLVVGAGRLGDLVGRRRLLLAGIAVFTLSSAACAFAPTLGVLILGRAAQGLGAAAMVALSMAFVTEIVPKSKTGGAMGLLGSMSAIGTSLGPSVGGILTVQLGWRSLFWVNVPLGVAAFLLVYRFLPNCKTVESSQVNFDKAGTVLLAFALSAYAAAITVGRGSFGALNVSLLLLSAIGIGMFVIAESRATSPLVEFALFREAGLSTRLTLSMVVSTVIMTTLVVGPFYLSRAFGLNAALVGITMSAGPIVASVTGVPAGRIVDRFGPEMMTRVALTGMVLGCVAMALIPSRVGVAGYVFPLIVVTANYAVFQAANNTSIMSGIAPEKRGVVSGLLNLSRSLGLITGVSLMGAVFAHAVGTNQVVTAKAQEIASGMKTTFGVAAILIAGGLLIACADSLQQWIPIRRGESRS